MLKMWSPDRSGPIGIALDLAAGHMYWTDWDLGRVQRSNLDGSRMEDLVTGLSRPTAVDLSGRRVYWLASDKIQRSNLDGSQVEDLVTTGLSSPWGLALDLARARMYWTDYGTEKIQRPTSTAPRWKTWSPPD